MANDTAEAGTGTILVVDDEPTIRRVLTLLLQSAGYEEVLTAGSAEEAFRHLNFDEPWNETAVDLVLTDINMPGINGIEAIRRIKQQPHLADLPIIVITVSDEDDNLRAAFQAGASDYITKPVRNIELLARVQSLLKLKREIDRRKARERDLITAQEELEQKNTILQELSWRDGLTGLANRRRFDEVLGEEWRRMKRLGAALSLILLDIDHFKAYNDALGHQKGDECLREVAATLAATVKRPGDLPARYGGEEFGVVLPHTDRVGAVALGEMIRGAIEELRIPHPASPTAEYVTVSLGVSSVYPSFESSPGILIESADQALYTAKQEGRNRTQVAPHRM